jgi:hypothetical protein
MKLDQKSKVKVCEEKKEEARRERERDKRRFQEIPFKQVLQRRECVLASETS